MVHFAPRTLVTRGAEKKVQICFDFILSGSGVKLGNYKENGVEKWRRSSTKGEWAINSATNGTTRGGGSQPPVQTTWSRHAPWQAWQDDCVNIGKLQTQLGDALEEVRSSEDYIKEVQIEMDKVQRHADEIQKKGCVR